MGDKALISEVSCRHTWSFWIKGVSPAASEDGLERPVATFRSNCTRCGLFRVIATGDGGEEPPDRPATCPRCYLPLDDPPGALRWPAALRFCGCGGRMQAEVIHDRGHCELRIVCPDCGASADEPLGDQD